MQADDVNQIYSPGLCSPGADKLIPMNAVKNPSHKGRGQVAAVALRRSTASIHSRLSLLALPSSAVMHNSLLMTDRKLLIAAPQSCCTIERLENDHVGEGGEVKLMQ